MKLKKRDRVTGVSVGDIIKDKLNGDVIKVTFVNQSFVDGLLYNSPKRDQFDTGERQVPMMHIEKV